MNNLLTQIQIAPAGGFRGFGPLGLEKVSNSNLVAGFFVFNQIISTTIGIITVVAIIWFVINIMIGAVSIIGSGGDKGKLEQARNKISSSIVGLIVVIAGVFVVQLLGYLIGIDILKGISLLLPQSPSR